MDKQNVIYPYKGLLSAINKNKILIHSTTWMNLRNIILSERSQIQRPIPYTTAFIWNVEKRYLHRDRMVGSCLGLGAGGGGRGLGLGSDYKWVDLREILDVMEKFWNWIVMMVAPFYTFNKNYWIVYFQWVNLVECKLYLDQAIKKCGQDQERWMGFIWSQQP